MKKAIAIALCLCIAFSLVACEEAAGSAPGDSASMPDLYAAVEKLAEADSFRITIERNDGIKPETELNQITRSDGELRMLCYSKRYANANTLVEGTSYVEGNEHYYSSSEDSYRQSKTIYADGCQIEEIVCSYGLVGDTKAFLDAFLATAPQSQTKDGMMVLSKKLSKEEYIALAYKIFSFIDEDYFALGKATVSVTVDAEGYLREVALKADLLGSSPSISFIIDQINEIAPLERPDYAENFTPNVGAPGENSKRLIVSSVSIRNGEYTAVYEHHPYMWSQQRGWTFIGFDGNWADSYVIPVYEIPEQIDGLPVEAFLCVFNNPFMQVEVERIVIPKGVKTLPAGEDGAESSNIMDTVLFFHDAEEDVEKNFGTWDKPHSNEDLYCYKAAYYAGEWEYVDGIPTPLN